VHKVSTQLDAWSDYLPKCVEEEFLANFAITEIYEVRGCYEFNSRSCSVLLCLSVREGRR
jgi:hypothetical protein